MKLPFSLLLAWREARSSWRRIGIYMGSITMGVGALVAINSFRANIVDSIRGEARTLLGADVRLESSAAFPPAVQAVVDSAAAAGADVSHVTSTASMAIATGSGRTRLFQLRAVTGSYPHYGEAVTDPPGLWPQLADQRIALVDPALLVQLDIQVGDTIQVGAARFPIAGTVEGLPSDIGFQTAIGPRIFIGGRYLEETDLIRFGSLVQYQTFLALDEPELSRFLDRYENRIRAERVRIETAEGEARDQIRAYGALANFLGLVGLTALLLGGIGVASAVHVFVKEKLTGIAVLRCIGATQREVFLAYLLQAALLGLAGSAAGAVLGVALQAVLPWLLSDYLPVEVGFALDLRSIAVGLAMGVWIAVLFSLLPLLAVRDVAPLQALRRDLEAVRGQDPARAAAILALAASVVALSIWQAPNALVGLAYATGLATTTGMLWLTARALILATRRLFPKRAPYVLRQGIANLFRPRNQTVVVTLSIGFGVFLLATLYVVQRNLLDRLDFADDGGRPSILLFDIQPDQRPGIEALARERGMPPLDVTPIIPARIAAINGRNVEELMRDAGVSRWALRREYRNTYRDTLAATETIAAGAWWGDEADRPATGSGATSEPPRISIEDDLAASLGVGIGDRITWDISGIRIESRIASLRTVDWTSFAPNFFVVFEPGVIERAPQTIVALGQLPDAAQRAEFQRDVVLRYPNVSALDLTLVQETIDAIAGKVALAIRVLALFGIGGGVLVLIGAVATSRYQRRRESALLKTLGASRSQVTRILLTEYFALGSLAALTGVVLSTVAAWLLMERVFQLDFSLPAVALAAIWGGVVALTLIVGLANSRDVLRRPPLAVLVDAYE